MGKKKDKKNKKDKQKATKEGKKLLKGVHCTDCKKHCPLKDPHCKKGRAQAEALLQKK